MFVVDNLTVTPYSMALVLYYCGLVVTIIIINPLTVDPANTRIMGHALIIIGIAISWKLY